MLDTLLKLDGDILLWIQDNLRAGWLDPIMKFITYLANGGALWIGICVLLLILKKTRTTGIVCSCSLAVTFLINNIILKNIIARTRPYEVVEGLNRIIGAQSDFSFAFSRLYVGVHYPFDVIAGVLTGTIYAVITVAIYRKFFKDKKHSEK